MTQDKDKHKFDLLHWPTIHKDQRKNGQVHGLILHGVGVPAQDIFDVFDQQGVSAHYVVPQMAGEEFVQLFPDHFKDIQLKFPHLPPVIQMVGEDEKAFHAGLSSHETLSNLPFCEKSLNECTIGIEFHAPGYGYGEKEGEWNWTHFVPFSKGQEQVGVELIKEIKERYQISAQHILAHSVVSPGRKTDPGPLFFWERLRDEGLIYM